MKRAKEKGAAQSRQRLSDLVGIDFAATGTKVVRIKNGRNGFSLCGIDQLPRVDFTEEVKRLELPKNLESYYGCLTYSGRESVVRMINAALPQDEQMLPADKLRELLNVSADYRVGAFLSRYSKGRKESSLMAAAIPDKDAHYLLNMFPSGAPAPCSIEVAGLSFISAFFNARGEELGNGAACLIEAGEELSYFSFLNEGVVTLVGKFGFGIRQLRAKVMDDLGVDDELAGSILMDRSINIASSLDSVMNPFLKQLSISKDFIERHQGCRVGRVYLSGGMSLIPHWPEVNQQLLKVEAVTWSPLENIQYDPELIPENLRGQACRFAAAIGAAIGGLQE
jgi:Tfp pilus assembly PilM family ATPase